LSADCPQKHIKRGSIGAGGLVLFVSDIANLLDIGGGLRDIVEGFPFKDQLILDVCRNGDFDARVESHPSNILFSQKVANFNGFTVAKTISLLPNRKTDCLGPYSMMLTLIGK
jgi:hypothetical protein